MKWFALTLLVVAFGWPWAFACMPTAADTARSVGERRDTICAFVAVWSLERTELAPIHTLCQQGANLKEIAAAYAGCSVD